MEKPRELSPNTKYVVKDGDGLAYIKEGDIIQLDWPRNSIESFEPFAPFFKDCQTGKSEPVSWFRFEPTTVKDTKFKGGDTVTLTRLAVPFMEKFGGYIGCNLEFIDYFDYDHSDSDKDCWIRTPKGTLAVRSEDLRRSTAKDIGMVDDPKYAIDKIYYRNDEGDWKPTPCSAGSIHATTSSALPLPADYGSWTGICETLIDNKPKKKTMNMVQRFKKLIEKEPTKTFRKLGMIDNEGQIYDEDVVDFARWMMTDTEMGTKYMEEILTPVLEDKEKKSTN